MIKSLTQNAMWIAVIVVIILFTQIPIYPFGYVNTGDGVLMLLPLIYPLRRSLYIGCIAVAIADFLSAFPIYAPFSLIVKAIGIIIVYYLHNKTGNLLSIYIACITMSISYSFVDCILLNSMTVLMPSFIANIPQLAVSPLLTVLLKKAILPLKNYIH